MANVPISALNPGGPVEDTDLFPDVQTVGVGPVKVTGAQIKTYTSDSPNLVTPDIGVATGTSLSLNTSGSYSTKIESSGLATQSWTLVLPPDDGTNGYILSTDGSGNTTWVNPTVIGIDINVNTTAIVGGTNKHLVYDNAGTFGEMSAITTDGAAALTLGTQQATQGTVVLANTAAGSFSTTIKSSNSATESWALTLPVSKGSNGYILTTDGTGVSAWTNPTALGIDIDVNSTAITGGASGRIVYDNAGTFGEASAITTNGSDTLTVGTQQTTQGSFVLSNTAAGAFPVTLKSSNSTSAAWTFTLPTTAGTNKYALTTNGSGVSSWSQIDLTAAVTGTLPVGNGGTGQTSLAVHGVVIGNSTSGVNVTATGSAGQVFQSGGALADPVWSTATFPSTATSAGTILRADGTNWVATTATYPTTTTINQILYSNANNQVTGLTTTNGGVVNTNSSGVPSVTVNPTLGVQQTTQGSLVLANTAAGAFSTTLKSSNSASAAWTFTFPVTAGTSGYFLITDGSGNSSWSNSIGIATGTSLALGGASIGTNALAITGTSSMGSATYFPAGSAGSPSIAYSSNTNTGMFFPTSSTLAFSTAGTERMRIDSSGYSAFGTTPASTTSLFVSNAPTTTTNSWGINVNYTTQSNSTNSSQYISAYNSTAAAAFTIGNIRGYYATQSTIGNGSIATSQYAYYIENSFTGATNNYGIYSNIPTAPTGGTSASTVSTIASSSTTTTVVTTASHGLSTNQVVTISATANATALVSGATVTILTVGTTDFTLIGASSNTVGVSFTATGAGTGSGTVTINQQGSGKTITVVDATTFTYSSTTGTYSAITALSGTVTPSTRWNIYANGTAPNYFAGRVGIGTNATTTASPVLINQTLTGSTNGNGLYVGPTVASDVTSGCNCIQAVGSTSAAAFTLNNLYCFTASQGTIGATSSVTNQYGFSAGSSLTGATNNYGFYSNIASTANRWNFFANGTANNAFAGNSRFGAITAPVATVDVTGSIAATTTILSSGAASGIGYSTGAGGAITQGTNRTTGVTLNNVSGAITLVSAAGTTTWQTFTVTNSTVAATDAIIVVQKSGTDLNEIHVTAVAAGSFNITFRTTGGTTVEQPVFNFAVIKAVAA